MLLIALFYLVTHHGTTYHTGHGRDILAGATTDLMSEHSAYDTADDGASTYPVATATGDLDHVNYAISIRGAGIG
ncbi:hypothetical protein [Sulfuricella sp.]|uniref:hypothetical protein n=1 Tax=Sulfuricella sp. TaxID=2099377 RepID=UPI002BFD7CCE|nr:hypothetical protein [Sulfuricella sp.]HUX65145.1 hypothetical protein [Sulfuricella sp.]